MLSRLLPLAQASALLAAAALASALAASGCAGPGARGQEASPAAASPAAAPPASPSSGKAGPDPGIRRSLEAFALTGDHRHLCRAALLGSEEAARRLEDGGLRCSVR